MAIINTTTSTTSKNNTEKKQTTIDNEFDSKYYSFMKDGNEK